MQSLPTSLVFRDTKGNKFSSGNNTFGPTLQDSQIVLGKSGVKPGSPQCSTQSHSGVQGQEQASGTVSLASRVPALGQVRVLIWSTRKTLLVLLISQFI